MFIASQEMPASSGAAPTVALEIFPFLSRGNGRRLVRINAYIDDLKVLANIQAQLLQCLDQAVINQRAQHRAMVIAWDQ